MTENSTTDDPIPEGVSPYTVPTWEPAVVWQLPDLQAEWDYIDDDELNGIPVLEPLPSEIEHGIRLTYAQYGTALSSQLSVGDWHNEYPIECVYEAGLLAMSLRRLGFDPTFGVAEWAAWRKHRPNTDPQVATL
jgi:hypothetical protein